MKLILTLLITFLGFAKGLQAQHCPYDGAHVLVVQPTAEGEKTVISNLKLTFVATSEFYFGGNPIKDTVELWVNPQETTHSGIIDNENPMNPWSIRFGFAEDNYVLVYGRGSKEMQLTIEDIDGKQNGGKFETKTIPISKDNFYSLCTGNSNWDLGEEGGFVEGFEPLRVELKKIN